MSLLNSTLQTLVVRLRDIGGNVSQQKLHNRVFDAYEAKSLAFELITPAQQAAMQQHGGCIPPMHPAGQPLLVDSWQELIQLHKPGNQYQLLPRRARSNASYAVLKAICSSAGSPFRMEHCQEPADYKLVFKAAEDHEVRNAFNARSVDKVTQTIFFDGLMASPTATALLCYHNVLSPVQVNNIAGSYHFLTAFCRTPSTADRHRQLKEYYQNMFRNPTHLFLGTVSPPGRELINYAKSKNVFIYAKKGLEYQYFP